jgi:hypothetical protein
VGLRDIFVHLIPHLSSSVGLRDIFVHLIPHLSSSVGLRDIFVHLIPHLSSSVGLRDIFVPENKKRVIHLFHRDADLNQHSRPPLMGGIR